MTLATEYTSRYSAARVLQLTNPDDPSATTNGSARLTAAAADAEGYFETLVGVSLDITDTRHLAYAVEGVDLLLQHRLDGSDRSRRNLEDWKERLAQLGLQTTRYAVTPVTTSRLTPSDEPTTRPVFDMQNLGDMRIRQPASTSPFERSFD